MADTHSTDSLAGPGDDMRCYQLHRHLSATGAHCVWWEEKISAHVFWTCDTVARDKGESAMLYTLAIILLIAWLLGIVGTYTLGAFVHVLLVIAIVLFLAGLVSGRRTLG
jgi:hypothetical protein